MPHGLLSYSGDLPFHRTKKIKDELCTKLGLKMKRSIIKFITFGALALCTCIYFLFVFILTDNVIIDDQFLSVVPESILEKRLDFQSMVIDRMCSEQTDMCYSVNDIKNEDGASRHLIVDGFEGESDTVVKLTAPNNANFDISDTRIWTINHLDIDTQYLAAFLATPFLISTLSLETGKDTDKSILEIGLGGGSFFMAMRHYKPEVKIITTELDPIVLELARKWFGVTENENGKTILADGLEYLKQMIGQDEKFDVIVLDACDTNKKMPCPAAAFRTVEAVKTIYNSLKLNGIALINILAYADRGGSPLDTINLFSEVFPTCIQLKMTQEFNILLICLNYTVGNPDQQIMFYQSRLKVVSEALSISHLLNNIIIARN